MIGEGAKQAAEAIRQKTGLKPAVGVVLGSGLGPFADDVDGPVAVSYSDIPGFPELTVAGHAGRLVLGTVSDVPVAVLQGRKHYYEAGDARAMNLPIATLRALGCEVLLTSNASGAILEGLEPGDLAIIADHINWVGASPLTGEKGIDDPFIDMVDAYDPSLRALMARAGTKCGLALREAVYTFLAGPQFETPAEIRAVQRMGGDLVGMSTVPEVILARYLGMRVAAVSVVTNRAAGMSETALSHAQTQANAKQAEKAMRALVAEFLATLREETV
ncbi:purine-nucleoside phosphorylase [Hwanghaeella sp.]|uniref:purine-nucleoside phosphorylase n=1 Tax=Hwanghaeella sp. TaxID=2605943 RepID=UPI003CCC091E